MSDIISLENILEKLNVIEKNIVKLATSEGYRDTRISKIEKEVKSLEDKVNILIKSDYSRSNLIKYCGIAGAFLTLLFVGAEVYIDYTSNTQPQKPQHILSVPDNLKK